MRLKPEENQYDKFNQPAIRNHDIHVIIPLKLMTGQTWCGSVLAQTRLQVVITYEGDGIPEKQRPGVVNLNVIQQSGILGGRTITLRENQRGARTAVEGEKQVI